MTITISDFWCGYIGGAGSMFLLIIALSVVASRAMQNKRDKQSVGTHPRGKA